MITKKDLLSILTFMFFGTSTLFAQTDWTMANANSNRTSCVANETELEPPFLEESEIPIKASRLAAKDNILIMAISGTPNTIKGYNLDTKTVIWEFSIPGTAGSPGMIPSISGNTVFVTGQHGKGLYALDLTTGTKNWLRPFNSLYAQNSITDNNQHVFITSGDSLFCLNVEDGKTVWSFLAPGLVSPTIKNDTVFITSATSLNALNSSNGEVFWTKDISNSQSRHMPVDNNTIYHLGKDRIRAYDINDGTEKWEYLTPNNFNVAYYLEGSGCLTDSILFASLLSSSDSSRIVALNKFTGKIIWEYVPTQKTFLIPPIAANGFIYAVSYFKKLIVLKEKTGEVVLEDSKITGKAIIHNHKLFACTNNSIIIYNPQSLANKTIELNNQDISVFPNPSGNKINVSYNLENSKHVKIELYDLSGNMVALLLDKNEETGKHQHTYNAEKYNNGTYLLLLNDGEKLIKQKVVILK